MKLVLQGQRSAAAVLDGQADDIAFRDAKDAAEKLLEVQFRTDREAAIAIVEFAESLKR